DGTTRWFQTTKVPLDSPEKPDVLLGVAIDITELKNSYDKLQRLLEETVNGLVSAVEMRDPYTAGHQRRVALLACAIAQEMDLTKDQINGIRIASNVHDIGKIYVPSEILSKPGRLTDVEFDLIKTHPQAGYDILCTIDFPWPVADIVLQHQERMDGKGYPNGISGKDIIFEARILSVADVVEAISSHRPYRPALGIEYALNEISTNKEILYDKNVVDICLKLFKENKFKFDE
ncbi:MAG: HD-GYP domain-containing protein, partial [Candidatus Cloacimonetes bacterium]|nr:HD-GYP domain-containing protein [Candidatus Cloacimonadota bacterium]